MTQNTRAKNIEMIALHTGVSTEALNVLNLSDEEFKNVAENLKLAVDEPRTNMKLSGVFALAAVAAHTLGHYVAPEFKIVGGFSIILSLIALASSPISEVVLPSKIKSVADNLRTKMQHQQNDAVFSATMTNPKP